jgi:rhodanese-related sulfurtransferase
MLTALALSAFVVACEGHEQTVSIGTVTVDQLASMQEAAKKAKTELFVLDANRPDTRADKGIIPGAVLLPSSTEYDVALLPKTKDAPLVFYCANERCSASKKAAKRALEAGYTNVNVLPEGIAGWLKAGKPVAKQPQA